jgi:hypothetical protein
MNLISPPAGRRLIADPSSATFMPPAVLFGAAGGHRLSRSTIRSSHALRFGVEVGDDAVPQYRHGSAWISATETW